MAAVTPEYTGALSTATIIYMDAFNSYSDQMMQWGKQFFSILLALNISWIAIWYAFDKDSLMAGMSDFLKKFTIAILFYGVMINPWFLTSLISTTTSMGKTLTGYPADPSSIISMGFSLGNKVIQQINASSFLTSTLGTFEALIVYVVIIFCFMSVALQVSVAKLISTALAMLACFSLSFAAFGGSAKIAHKTIDALIGNCFKLLGYYVVIGSSLKVFKSIEKLTPNGFEDMTPYGWMCASALLMWLLSKNLAGVFERIGSGIVGDTQGADAAALALSAVRTASTVVSGVGTAAKVAKGAYKLGKATVKGSAKLASKVKGGASTKPPSGSSKNKTEANNSGTKGSNNNGGGQGKMKAVGSAAAAASNGKGNLQNKTTPKSGMGNGNADKSGGGSKNSSKNASKSGRAHTYPDMSKDKKNNK